MRTCRKRPLPRINVGEACGRHFYEAKASRAAGFPIVVRVTDSKVPYSTNGLRTSE
jgi:hypothetical protein